MGGATYRLMIVPMTLLIAGCGLSDRPQAEAPIATATVTVTVTATPTEAPSVDTELLDKLLPDDLGATGPDETGATLPRLKLRVFADGCGVIRSRPRKGVGYDNLTWSFRDRDGFQVLGRNAHGETRYRYYLAGNYTVVLEAWTGNRYAPVSNKVTVHC
jgi:hypothetical protein